MDTIIVKSGETANNIVRLIRKETFAAYPDKLTVAHYEFWFDLLVNRINKSFSPNIRKLDEQANTGIPESYMGWLNHFFRTHHDQLQKIVNKVTKLSREVLFGYLPETPKILPKKKIKKKIKKPIKITKWQELDNVTNWREPKKEDLIRKEEDFLDNCFNGRDDFTLRYELIRPRRRRPNLTWYDNKRDPQGFYMAYWGIWNIDY